MTDYQEEQSVELETLRCIYTAEELTEVSENPPCFRIKVSLEAEDEGDLSVSVEVQFTLPKTYPDSPPTMEVVSQSGLADEQAEQLVEKLQEQAADNVGMVMVFTLVSFVQEWMQGVCEGVREERERERKRKEEEEKRREEARLHGTPVTIENFLEWRRKFEQEMAVEKGGKGRESSQQAAKLTGRQMFENDASLAQSDARFLTEGAVVEQIEVDESLFQDLEDLTVEEQS